MFDEKHNHTHAQNRFAVIPMAEKLNAPAEFTGKGITIAFLDSGFYPHPDFVERVVKFHDISGVEKSLKSLKPKGYHWHGTQTVVACAGDGLLSDGIYKGLAHQAKLVLVKVSKAGRISDDSIEKGLQWVIKNREKFEIRIVNLSLGGDHDVPFNESRINQLAEELVKLGVIVTVAAGNSGERRSIPPANSPSVITVGGYSDENQFENKGFDLYHSNFGETIDGLVKPEIIAPAMFVAVPILPETDDYQIAETLSEIANSPDYIFRQILVKNWQKADLSEDILKTEKDTARQIIERELQHRKVVATHYQHVDGTSFAAPIIASVVAQMLEANPGLTPTMVKNILISTASRLSGFSAIRQGFGILNAGLAMAEAITEMHFFDPETLIPPRLEGEKIVFFYHDDNAETVNLSGDFNDWKTSANIFVKFADGLWRAEIPIIPSGKYRYKFVVNGERWLEDTSNGMKEEDGFGGFNSILQIS